MAKLILFDHEGNPLFLFSYTVEHLEVVNKRFSEIPHIFLILGEIFDQLNKSPKNYYHS